MKALGKISLILGVFSMILSSCTGYHYVSPVPSAPQFEKAGELQGQLFASFTQVGFQSSFAVTSYLGASYAGYRSGLLYIYIAQPESD